MKIHRRKSRLPLALLSAVILSVISVSGVYFWPFDSAENLAPVTTKRTASPDEVVAIDEALQDFSPLSEQPTRLLIDKIGVDAEIEPLGLTSEGLMDDPDTNEGVGWYDQSAKAGEGHLAMLLDGHYGVESPGVFRDLHKMNPGDTMKVRGENGTTLTYRVVELLQQRIEDVDMNRALHPYREGVQSLTIITCEGYFDAEAATYDKRTILYAERIK